jgi:lipoprotein NlpI
MRLWLCCLIALVWGAAAAAATGYDDFAQGLSALNSGDNDRALSSFSAALAAGDLNANFVPTAYFDRGRLYLAKKECALAAADLTAAIKLRPDYLDAYLGRISAEECLNDNAAVIADFTQAIALQPTGRMYAGRGRAHWNQSDFADAAADFAEAAKLVPKGPYILLWLEISRMRAGTSAVDATAPAAFDSDDWPKPVFALFGAKATPDDVMRAADQGDADTAPARQCEADFYVAEWWLIQQKTDAARPLLENARAQCKHTSREYSAAAIELRRLR